MSDANLRQIRVLHIVSAGALANSLQQSLFMPLLTRLPRARVKSLVACLSPGAVPAAVLRQSGVPTYDLALSRKRFSPRALQELQQVARNFRPDVIQAWGHTAQVVSGWLRPRCEWKPRVVWSIADTLPVAKNAGLVDRQKLKYAAKFARRADRVVYSSEAAASAHQRVGFPDDEHETIPPGVDATRFKPDFAARRRLREQWSLPGETFVIGMYAPFQPEYDFPTLIKAVGELIKTHPNVALVLAGHGVQKGNAPLMALVGGGALATRVHLLGEWSDVAALYNACDVVCSSALNDQSRMNLVMAMLCGVPCVATGMGAQGEVIGQHGVAIEAGNPAAFVKGITRVMQMTPDKRTFMAQGARKHALANYVYVRSLQKYLQLYHDLIGRQSLVTQDLPTPEMDPTLTVPPALPTEAELNAAKRKQPKLVDWNDPDSLETKVAERAPEELPKWRIEQEQERSKREAEVAAKVAATNSSGDVLQVFEAQQSSAPAAVTPMAERARGVADEVEDLLSPELLTVEVPVLPRMPNAPSGAKKTSNASRPDAAQRAALKAAQKAALQPIAAPPKRPAKVKPAVAAKAAASVAHSTRQNSGQSADRSADLNSTQPLELLSPSALLRTPTVPIRAISTDAGSVTQGSKTLPKIDTSSTQPMRALADDTAPLSMFPQIDLSLPTQVLTPAASVSAATVEKASTATQASDLLPEIDLSLVTGSPAVPTQAAASSQQVDASGSPLGRLAKALATAKVPPAPAPAAGSHASHEPARAADSKTATAGATASMTAALDKWNSSFDPGELSLMATGAWAAAPSKADAKTESDASDADGLSGAEALSLISSPPADETVSATADTLKLEALPESARRAANAK